MSAWPESAVQEVAVLNEALVNAENEIRHLKRELLRCAEEAGTMYARGVAIGRRVASDEERNA